MTVVDTPLPYAEILDAIYDAIDEPVIVPNLGSNTSVAMRHHPTDATLYLWGGMGLTHSIGLGLALGLPRRTIVVVDGDGSLLMGLSGLATIGVHRPRNLLHVVVDNQVWGNTGGQPTHTADGLRLEAVASACGYPVAMRSETIQDFRMALARFSAQPECTLVVMPIEYLDPGRAPLAPDPVGIKNRFMAAVESSTLDAR